MNRSSGILLHPSSLPSPYGMGDLGKEAYRFVDWLDKAGQSLWQMLPLGPTGYGDSPYASFSTFAGNPNLIALEPLLRDGYLSKQDLRALRKLNADHIDYGQIIPLKQRALAIAAKAFLKNSTQSKNKSFAQFKKAEAWWLNDYALFMSIKNSQDIIASENNIEGAIWSTFWPKKLALREKKALFDWEESNKLNIELIKVIQYFFFSQWLALKKYANDKGISIVGDLPIFVANDSVDVWSHRELFQLDAAGQPVAVAGVPPDYFSATGQLWGNPLYDWPKHQENGFSWWIQRIKSNLVLFDYLRIDHFRGFESFWSIPFGNKNAVVGSWEKAPGQEFFSKLKSQLPSLPILAEDLGFITDEVRKLRDSFSLPGMRILQFAFDAKESGKGLDVENSFLPHMYTKNSIVYTGTHDNDTLLSWIQKAKKKELDFIYTYLGYKPKNLVQELIRLALSSVADFAIIPIQDILGLASEARMNTPSTIGGNWTWRLRKGQLTTKLAVSLKRMSHIYARNLKK